MLIRFVSTLLIISICGSAAFAGGNITAGGSPNTVSAGAIKILVEDGGLKKAMLNYIETLQTNQVEDVLVRNQFVRMMSERSLVHDIQESHYVLATPSSPCKDAYDNAVPASAMIGKPQSDICFDVEKLVHSFQGLSEEDVMIQLSSLAFHEHTHHYQIFSKETIQQNEANANRIAGYVLITAKFVQLPLLHWTKPGSGPAEFQAIETMYAAIKAKEQAFIAPAPSDYSNYPGFQGQKDKGVVRLLPREKYDRKLSISGGGAYYSFVLLTHEYGYGSDISLGDHKLNAGGSAGCDFGFFADLGTVSLESINEQSPALKFLLTFAPADGNEPLIRKQENMVFENRLSDKGILFPHSIKDFYVGQTLGLRSIAFDKMDVLVVLKIIRIDEDGSVILAWKKIKSFPVSSCNTK
jgi:hypothetical protein